jgi:hypothetical protein
MARLDRVATAVAALLIALFGFLPIANWLPGGFAVPAWGDLVDGWWSGTGIVAGLSLVVVLLTRRIQTLPGQRLLWAAFRSYVAAPAAWCAGIAFLALLVYLWIAHDVFSAKPLLIDEVAQVFQARIFADGALYRTAPQHPEFFSSLHLLNLDGKVFSQFPAGGPAMLALGTLIGAEWTVGPVFGAVSVVFFGALVRHLEPRPGVALAAILLFAFAPFAAFMSGSHMNHVTGLTWLLAGIVGLARVTSRPVPRLRDGLLLGVGFGIAATIRPSDAFVFALPAGCWLLARAARSGSWQAVLGAVIGVVGPVVALLGVNAATTGSPLTFGYSAYWGVAQSIGFHVTPWGDQHAPARGLELLNLYFVRLQSYLFETPVPSLVPAVVGLFLSRRLTGLDRYLLLTVILLMGFYFAYWHDGYYLGPRFMFPLAPLLALWTARGFALVVERWPSPRVQRGLGVGAAAALVIGLIVTVPARAERYRKDLAIMRWNADRAAHAAGITQALVFVRESWGAQLIARMWAAGVNPDQAEVQYRKSDACALEQALDRIEARGLRGPGAMEELLPLLADSARLVRSATAGTRLLPGARYTGECVARLREDDEGFTIHLPLLLAGRSQDIVYARDLHGRDSLLLTQYPTRPVYLLRPPGTDPGTDPHFVALERDSLLAAWRRGE